MRIDQLAINSVSTGGQNLETRLDAYAEAGFRNVEFMLGHVKEYLAQGHSAGDARRLLDDRNLRCIGGFECGIEAFSDPDSRSKNHALIISNAQLLGELGGTKLVVGTDGPKNTASDPIKELAGAVGEVADRIRDTGVDLCIEFNWSPFVRTLRTAADIARASNKKNVGVLFDPAHYYCTPTKFAELTPENVAAIKHVHVDNMRDKPAELSDCNSDRLLPGSGVLDLAALFGRIEEYGYDGYFSIEMFDKDLVNMPVERSAKLMYQSLLTLIPE